MLPYDVCRCQTLICPKRDQCQRHIDLANLGPRSPVAFELCMKYDDAEVTGYWKFDSFIPKEK